MTPAMRDMECCLERALIVWVGGTRPTVTAQVVQALQAERGLSPSCFSVHLYYLENSLVIFDSISSKDLILQGGSIKMAS